MYDFDFIPYINLKNKIKYLSELTWHEVYITFLLNEIEVLYIVNDYEKLIGIITTGDFNNYLSCKNEDYLNTNFIYVNSIDYNSAKIVFDKIPKIHEVAVVENGYFKGVICNNKENKADYEWNQIRNTLRLLHPYNIYYIEQLIDKVTEKFKNNDFYVFSMVDHSFLKSEDRKKVEKRCNKDMLAVLKNMDIDEQKKYWKELYSEGFAERFIEDYSDLKIITKNGISNFSDVKNDSFFISNSQRKITNIPNDISTRIVFLGPCNAFGAFVPDNYTIEYYLQSLLNDISNDIGVINLAVNKHLSLERLVSEKFFSNDIFIIFPIGFSNEYESLLWNRLSKKKNNIHVIENGYKAWDFYEVSDNLLDSTGHCNHIINKNIADIIFEEILPVIKKINNNTDRIEKEPIQDYYILPEIAPYYDILFYQNGVECVTNRINGAIVMNCNPFTKGHRYLIEQALKYVDYLYIFVVEEDKSYYKFKDRYEMVNLGLSDINNVKVLPSGNFIISNETFAQYFEKENIKEVFDMDYDIHIFAEVIAKMLNITYRFAGEEPFDIVTKKYNETMKRILPESGINFVEIPRLKTDEDIVISASTVRKNLDNEEVLSKLLPDTTINYLRNN